MSLQIPRANRSSLNFYNIQLPMYCASWNGGWLYNWIIIYSRKVGSPDLIYMYKPTCNIMLFSLIGPILRTKGVQTWNIFFEVIHVLPGN